MRSCTNRGLFATSFQVGCIYFSRLFIQSRTSCIMLNKSVESGHSWLIPDIKGKASLILTVMFAMSFSYMPFHFVDIASILVC